MNRVVPLKESAPRVPSPYGDHIFYYSQIDTLARLSKGKNWKFADIRPDAIVVPHLPCFTSTILYFMQVGFVPNHNPMNIAEPIGLYLSLWKSLSPSLEVPFPGTAESYTHLQSNISADQLGRFHIYTSLHPDKTAGKSFNIADVDEGFSWEMIWPGIAAYFGLKGVGPVAKGELSGEEWVKAQKPIWESWTKEKGLRPKVLDNTCWEFMTIVT